MRAALAAWVLSLGMTLGAHARAAPKSATKRFPAATASGRTESKAPHAREADKSTSGDDSRALARQMAREAIELMHDSRWAEAEALLGRAYQMVQAPTVAVLRGRCLEELGKLTLAAESYEAATHAPAEGASEAFKKAADEAARRLAEVRERTPKISIVLEGERLDEQGIVLSVDAKPLAREAWSSPVLVDPGDHVIAASVKGRPAVEDQVMLKEGESKQVVLHLHGEAAPPPPPAPAPAPRAEPPPARLEPSSSAKTWGFVSLGIGAAGMATGIVAGVVMLDSKSSLDTECTPACPPGAEAEISRFREARVVSAIGYGVGIVGLGVGAAILLLSPTPRQDARAARVRVIGDLRTVGVEGTF